MGRLNESETTRPVLTRSNVRPTGPCQDPAASRSLLTEAPRTFGFLAQNVAIEFDGEQADAEPVEIECSIRGEMTERPCAGPSIRSCGWIWANTAMRDSCVPCAAPPRRRARSPRCPPGPFKGSRDRCPSPSAHGLAPATRPASARSDRPFLVWRRRSSAFPTAPDPAGWLPVITGHMRAVAWRSVERFGAANVVVDLRCRA